MKNLVYALVVFHFAVIVFNFVSMIILPFTQTDWYIILPLETFLGNLFFNRTFVHCPLTKAENWLRNKAGLPEIKGFVTHYILIPIRRFNRKWKKKID